MDAGISYDGAATPEGMRLYAIGDVHGRADCLADLLGKIDTEIARDKPKDSRVIYLGDYVDRGPDSASAIEMVATRMTADPRHIALKGNHDDAFAGFLASPANWRQFAAFEGETTARSYGIEIDFSDERAIRNSQAALCASMPESHVRFLNRLKLSASFGDFFFCHAGIRPGVPLDRQDPHDLLWIRREFHAFTGLHPKLIVHGHTPHDRVELRSNRVNLDTWAVATGRLTAMVMDGMEKRFLATALGA